MGAVITQIPFNHTNRNLQSEEHALLMFLSGSFAGVQLHWSIVEKEAYAIVATCNKADYLLHRPEKFHLYTDHRRLCYLSAHSGWWQKF